VLDNEATRIRRFDAKPEAAPAKPESTPAKQKLVDHTQEQIKPVTRFSKSYWLGSRCAATPHHNQVYPLPADLDFKKFIVGAM